MKSNELKEVIRQLIREELEKTLPTLIPKVLTEILTGNKTNLTESIVETPPVIKQTTQKPKELKKYTSNPILNEVLNQTVVKIPAEDSNVGLESSFRSQALSGLKLEENVKPEPVTPVTEEQGKVMNVLKRDFRSLMKAVDKKRQSGNLGSSAVSMQ